PNSIWPTNFSSGRLSPSHSSVENFVSCAFSRERSLLSCTWGRLRDRLDFSQKHFSHGFRPWPLHKPSKPQKLLALLQSASKSEETPARKWLHHQHQLTGWVRGSTYRVCVLYDQGRHRAPHEVPRRGVGQIQHHRQRCRSYLH